jgi:hypothetical protein
LAVAKTYHKSKRGIFHTSKGVGLEINAEKKQACADVSSSSSESKNSDQNRNRKYE